MSRVIYSVDLSLIHKILILFRPPAWVQNYIGLVNLDL